MRIESGVLSRRDRIGPAVAMKSACQCVFTVAKGACV